MKRISHIEICVPRSTIHDMRIGIDGSRAFLAQRTGIEEYSYQVIKSLRNYLKDAQVILYLRKDQKVDFDLPKNWEVKIINFPYLWTQLGLSLEMFLQPVDVLFIPAHTVPTIHPKNTVVAIHGLEYEFCPQAYSFWARLYMRTTIRMSCRWAKKIISVSENTKKDLVNLYSVLENKIGVIYEGYEEKYVIASEDVNDNSHRSAAIPMQQNTEHDNTSEVKDEIAAFVPRRNSLAMTNNGKYLLFIGRLEERKNIVGIIKAFEILKEHYKIPHQLILAGKFGYGAEKIQAELKNTNVGKDIILPGFISEEEKWKLLKGADVFLFPTFYEGFGIPILEAQSVGCPVVCSDNSSIPEVVNDCHPELDSGSNLSVGLPQSIRFRVKPGMTNISALLVDPMNAEAIADAAYKLLSDKTLRDDIIKKGYENVKRFSWDKCASEIAEVLR